MQIRPATDADIPTLRQFEQALIEAERPFDPSLRPDGITYYDLENLVASDQSHVVVIEDGGVLIASGYVQIRDAKPLYQHTQVGYIGFLFVAPASRGQGLVQRVLDSLCDWSRARGVRRVELEVYARNAAAIAAYERTGFTPALTKMALELEP